VWLDKGELDKIIEKSQQDLRTQNAGDRNYDRYDDDDEVKGPNRRKRGGFLGNLFDFD
jgi:Zn-finger nucleic acid-binding protein